MSQENQSCLRFSLEESLWFRKGQEVEELISISLDPDITIQENDQYVTIRGSLELTGEYKSYETNNENDEGFTSQKFVERVDEREEGTCEFSHRFPVDITIPNNRIQSIYDIDVLVESFDYSIPERSCLKLAAELTISGLYGTEQQQQQSQQEQLEEIEVQEQPEVVAELEVLHRSETDNFDEEAQEVEVELTSVQSSYKDNFLFEVEARKPQKEESVEVLPKFPTFNYQPQEEVEEEESYQPSWSFQEARSEASHPEEAPVPFEDVGEEVPAPTPAPTVQFEEEVMTAEESSSSPEEPPAKNIKKKKAAKKKSMTLTEFFARKDESTEHARVKICIVQKGDTVNTVADRYDVSVPNLLRVNNLELTQDIFEGQVLYIPGSLAKK